MPKTLERNKQKKDDTMINENENEILIIRKAFKDDRRIIEKTPDEERKIDLKYYQGGSVYLTEDNEYIDLEIQNRDYDIEDHINYIEFAEQLYEKQKKKVNVYIYCNPKIKINIEMYNIKSDADFKLKLSQIQNPSKLKKIRQKLRK